MYNSIILGIGFFHFQGNLKTLDTIGNCQRPVFSLGLSQHMHKLNENLSLIGRRSCKIIMKEKTPCHTKFMALRCLISRPFKNFKFAGNYFFVENFVTSEGVVSHNVFDYQPLPHYSSSRKVLC